MGKRKDGGDQEEKVDEEVDDPEGEIAEEKTQKKRKRMLQYGLRPDRK